jgi:aminomethyltransferase
MKPFRFSRAEVSSTSCLISRTGYTGEDGFELYCDPHEGERLWTRLLDAGRSFELLPVGLGARDTLRLERALPLYGHELDEDTTPLEAGLEWVTKLSKGTFLGREALLRQKQEGLKRKLVGLELIDPGIARGEYPIFDRKGLPVGRVTSGTKSPTLGRSIAMGYVLIEEAAEGNVVAVEIRGRKAAAKIVPLPFYRR